MSETTEGLPIPAHLASEFYCWLWWASEQQEGVFDLGGEAGRVELWIDERLAFRNPAENKVTAVMTGDNPGATLESRAALAGGKVLQELRLAIRRDEREFSVTLKGAAMDFQRVKLPQAVEGGEEGLYDRMFLYDELCFVISRLLLRFTELRTSDEWRSDALPQLQQWVQGVD